MKKGIALFFMLLFIAVRGQEYGYLVETEITGALHANTGSLRINSSVGHIGTVSSVAQLSNVGSISFNFFYVPNNFESIDINVKNRAISIANFPDCDYERVYNATKDNFNTNSYIIFSGCSFYNRVYPIHIIPPTHEESTICLDKIVTLKHGYNWQHSIDGITWFNFPQNLNKKAVTSFKLEELSNLDTNYRGPIKFRTGYNNSFTNIVDYTIISCSPQLVENGFSSTNTSCSYTDDGGFSMILDRQIPENKKLVVSLFFENEFIADDYNLLTQKVIEELIDNENGTYTYLWPDDTPIKKGNYKVRYQTLDTSADNPIWDSLEGTEDGFTIAGPSPLIFSLSLENNVNCFNGSDGRIRVSSYGGSGGYKYFLEGNVVPFTNTGVGTQTAPINQIVTGLSSGQKNIKVQDVNNCEEQN